MSPNPSSVPRPAVRIITSYDTDVAGAADALLATLRPAPQPDAQTPSPERRENSDIDEMTVGHSTAA